MVDHVSIAKLIYNIIDCAGVISSYTREGHNKRDVEDNTEQLLNPTYECYKARSSAYDLWIFELCTDYPGLYPSWSLP